MSHRPTLVLALASLTACAGQSVPPAEPAPAPEPPPAAQPAPAAEPGSAAEPSAGVSEEIARQAAAADSTRNAYTQADIDFMAGMIHHHAQALTMSRMAPTHGASDPLQIMTARIINAQKDEIWLMQEWLRARGQPVPDPPEMRDEGAVGHDDEPDAAGGHDGNPEAARGHAGHDGDPAEEHAGHDGHPAEEHAGHEGHGDAEDAHDMHMPGMLTPEQMAALDAARGEDWDRLFLQFMIQHHEGAVAMVRELFATPGAAQEDAVFKLANDIGADQASEIERMRTMLAEILVADDF